MMTVSIVRQWQIDGTVFTISDKLYFMYSGWPLGETSLDKVQELFIVSLSDPTHANSEPTLISSPTEDWEVYHDERGEHWIEEGPQFVRCEWFVGIVFSACASWSAEYKLATLALTDESNPLAASSWRKSSGPVLRRHKERERGPYGPGHASFVEDERGELWCVYHATDRFDEGWENRKARAIKVLEGRDGELKTIDVGTYACVHDGDWGSWRKIIDRLKNAILKAIS
jgi:GH43 family beta-xylosidase